MLKSQKNPSRKNKIIGINLIPNEKIKEFAPYLCDKDYLFSAKTILDCVDYMVLNFSGINKNSLSHYFEEDNLMKLLNLLQNLRIENKKFPRILIKIDPDLNPDIQKKICNVAMDIKLDGIIVGEMLKKKKKNNNDQFTFEPNHEMKLIEMQALRFISENTDSEKY